MEAELSAAVDFASCSVDKPLIALGSGGALPVAQVACTLHELETGQPAIAMTPFAFFRSRLQLTNAAVLCISSGGNNPDILTAFESARRREPAALAVLCGNPDSTLIQRASKHSWIDPLVFQLPSPDGFLATHSVVGFSLILARAFRSAQNHKRDFPKSLPTLLGHRRWSSARLNLRRTAESLCGGDTVLVIYSPLLRAAALDLESRCAEAALSNVWLSDLRNFGHGRHHWLAKRASTSAVLALATTQDSDLLNRTISLIPSEIPSASLVFDRSEAHAIIASLVSTVLLPETIGHAFGIDPAKPGVPVFGRKLYRLRPKQPSLSDHTAYAVERKLGTSLDSLSDRDRQQWLQDYHRYIDRFNATTFDAIVFDYDGTLCDVDDRFDDLPRDTAELLNNLLSEGVIIAVATGRGSSVLASLRARVDSRFWPTLIVGIHNCSRIQTLASDTPIWISPTSPEIATFAKALEATDALTRLATLRPTDSSISIRPRESHAFSTIQQLTRSLLQMHSLPLKLQHSTHSLDVLPLNVSKTNVLQHLQTAHGVTCPCAIGDRGNADGNDFELLHACLSLSVDQSSLLPDFCWNLAPPGIRSRDATHYYLGRSRILKGGRLRFRLG